MAGGLQKWGTGEGSQPFPHPTQDSGGQSQVGLDRWPGTECRGQPGARALQLCAPVLQKHTAQSSEPPRRSEQNPLGKNTAAVCRDKLHLHKQKTTVCYPLSQYQLCAFHPSFKRLQGEEGSRRSGTLAYNTFSFLMA